MDESSRNTIPFSLLMTASTLVSTLSSPVAAGRKRRRAARSDAICCTGGRSLRYLW